GREVRQAQRELLVDRKAARSDRLDAARSLGLAWREADQPAVDPALLARRGGMDAGVFDPREPGGVEAGGHRTGAARSASARAAISRAKSRNACAPFDAGSNATPGMP